MISISTCSQSIIDSIMKFLATRYVLLFIIECKWLLHTTIISNSLSWILGIEALFDYGLIPIEEWQFLPLWENWFSPKHQGHLKLFSVIKQSVSLYTNTEIKVEISHIHLYIHILKESFFYRNWITFNRLFVSQVMYLTLKRQIIKWGTCEGHKPT